MDNNYSLIYHSLFGNLTKINNNVISLIDNEEALNKSHDEKIVKTIKHLMDKNFIVKQGDDEYSVIRKKMDERAEQLRKGALIGEIQLSVSNKCNMNCAYCFEKKIDNSKRNWSQKMEFDTARKGIDKVLRVAKENGRDYISINFFGGEPLTNFEVIKKVLEHFGQGEEYGVKIGYSIDTNGILITEEIARVFSKYNVLVNLSIDYISNASNYRADGDTGALFEQFDRSLKILKSYNVLTYFLTVLSKDTFEKVSTSLLDYAIENNVKGNDIILSFDLDFENRYSIEEVVEKIVEYYAYGRKLGIHVGGYWGSIIDQMERVSLRNIEGFKSCPGIGRRLSIEPNGDVFACKSSSKIYGNIDDLEGILTSKQYHEYGMRAFRNSPSCEGCSIEGFCSGPCLGTLERKYDNITTMDPFLCDIYKKLVREILKVKYGN
ncbi:radical SAM protein [Acetivibrio clariflavus]|uniref:radical SAM/SPASM domain-containing protein n=1 Tax=Acetivibrio clariflavus TaxID=288965 RepID=UPI0031F570B6